MPTIRLCVTRTLQLILFFYLMASAPLVLHAFFYETPKVIWSAITGDYHEDYP